MSSILKRENPYVFLVLVFGFLLCVWFGVCGGFGLVLVLCVSVFCFGVFVWFLLLFWCVCVFCLFFFGVGGVVKEVCGIKLSDQTTDSASAIRDNSASAVLSDCETPCFMSLCMSEVDLHPSIIRQIH